jgi:short-subunit dehydrogenase
MIKAGSGNIINIASTAAFQPVPKLAAYAASKSYVMNFSDAIAYELKNKNIKVLTVSPGATQSEFGSTAGFGDDAAFFNKMPSSEDLAKFTYKAMTKQKTNAIHGLKNRFMAFSNRFAPRKMTTAIAAMMME